jgi:hypothetical protein
LDSLHTPIPDWIPHDHPARAVLAKRQGKRRGRINYRALDPDEYSSNIPTWESLLGVRLIGIGDFGNEYQLLFLASDGRCFSEDIVDNDVFYYEAESLVQFQLMTILGKKSRPMLRPDQESVMAYGITMTRESPQVYPIPKS